MTERRVVRKTEHTADQQQGTHCSGLQDMSYKRVTSPRPGPPAATRASNNTQATYTHPPASRPRCLRHQRHHHQRSQRLRRWPPPLQLLLQTRRRVPGWHLQQHVESCRHLHTRQGEGLSAGRAPPLPGALCRWLLAASQLHCRCQCVQNTQNSLPSVTKRRSCQYGIGRSHATPARRFLARKPATQIILRD